jgi:teichuronic acid biosynthesis glycosyltransferase TuaH
VRRSESLIVSRSTAVATVSEPLAANIAQRYGRAVDAVIENGVDYERFAQVPRAAPDGRRPRFVYAGTLKPTVDFDALEQLAAAVPDADIVLAGTVRPQCQRDLNRLTRLPNVRHMGAVPPDEVPAILADADVGLMPYRSTDWTATASALKLFEYLAAGMPVVGKGLPASVQHQRSGLYVHASATEGFVEAARALVSNPAPPDLAEECRAVAALHSWESEFARLLALSAEGRVRA